MVPCKCIDDTKKPPEIPQDKWIVKDEEYRVLAIYIHVNQGGIQGITLVEKPLDETCRPYQTFAIKRFAFRLEDIPALIQLAKDCSDIQTLNDSELAELLQEQVLETVENE